MTNRTASILLVTTVLIAILGGVFMPPSPSFGEMGKFINYAYMADILAVWFLIATKVFSNLGPLNFKWESLQRCQDNFYIFYVFLTKEAREEWRSYINEKKKEAS